jgi:aryl-alcohol dehydrogenase-like predicted oxidoreductase
MKQRKLGADGPLVSAIGLGCMSFGGIFGKTDLAASLRCLDAAKDQGLTFLDVANIYGNGLCEEVLGTWFKGSTRDMVVATKASIINGPPRRFDNSEAYLRAELEGSLRRMGIDHVDLFYIHRREDERPLEEVIGTLSRLIEEGKIGGYGLSEVSPGTVRRAHALHPCRAVQNEYSLWTRLPELGMIQTCADLGIAFVPFSPVGRGAFGREMLDPGKLHPKDFRLTIPRFIGQDWQDNAAKIHEYRALAASMGHNPAALAMAWVLHQGPHLLPIPGTRTAEHLGDWIGASEIVLSAQDLAAIDDVLPVGWAYGDRYGQEQAMTVQRYC